MSLVGRFSLVLFLQFLLSLHFDTLFVVLSLAVSLHLRLVIESEHANLAFYLFTALEFLLLDDWLTLFGLLLLGHRIL